MGRRNRLLAGALLAGLAFLIGSAGCGREAPRTPLVLLHCDELTGLFRSIEEVFERANPGIDIRAESLPTLQTIRKLTDQSRRCDLIAVVDPATLRRMLCPETARWVVAFASDRLVLAAADRSRYIHEIDADNWFQILLRPDVAFARVDERLDPAGLYTRMAWKLADARYGAYRGSTISGALGNACKPNNVRPSTNDLMTLLATPSGPDYVFVYRSMAEQHRQQYIELPDEINLGRPDLAKDYARVSVVVSEGSGAERTETGRPILFGLAVPVEAEHPDEAIELARFLLSEPGRTMMTKAGLQPVVPARGAEADAIPQRLQPYVNASE